MFTTKYKKHHRLLSLLLVAAVVIGLIPAVLADNEDSVAESPTAVTEETSEESATEPEPTTSPPEPTAMDGQPLTRSEMLQWARSAKATMTKGTCVKFAEFCSPTWYCNRYYTSGGHVYGHYFYSSTIAYHNIDGELSYCIEPNVTSYANQSYVYTYGIDLTKYFSDDAGNYDNVKFLLHNTTDGYYVQAKLDEESGTYYVTGHTTKESEATLFSPMSKGENYRKIVVKGLEDDTYVITEIATDDGYVLLKESITVEIAATEGTNTCPDCEAKLLTASAKVNGQTVEMNADGESVSAIVPLTVTNTKGFDLPKTGGSGTVLFYLLGGLAVLTAAGSAIVLLRKKHGQA